MERFREDAMVTMACDFYLSAGHHWLVGDWCRRYIPGINAIVTALNCAIANEYELVLHVE